MKKILAISAALLVFTAAEGFSLGLGVQFGGSVGGGFGGGASLLLSPSSSVHGAIDWWAGSALGLGGSLDFWFHQWRLTKVGSGSLDFYIGGGIYAWFWGYSDDVAIGAGLRLPIGIDLKLKPFDFFLQIVPRLGFQVLPGFEFAGSWAAGNLGFRYWF